MGLPYRMPCSSQPSGMPIQERENVHHPVLSLATIMTALYHTMKHNQSRAVQIGTQNPCGVLSAPDLGKLARAVLDALTGIVWVDDDQVVDLVCRKRWWVEDVGRIKVVAAEGSSWKST